MQFGLLPLLAIPPEAIMDTGQEIGPLSIRIGEMMEAPPVHHRC